MFILLKKVFIGLLRFGGSLVFERRVADCKISDHKECVVLNNQPSQPSPILINLNLDQVYYYPFVASVNKCGGSCNLTSTDDLLG